MAEAILPSVFVNGVCEKTTSFLLTDRFQSLWYADIHNDLTKLNERMKIIQAFLEDAEEKQLEDRSNRLWISKLKDVAYETDRLVDDLQSEVMRNPADLRTRVRNFFSSENHILIRTKISIRIEDVMKKIDEIASDRSKFNFNQINNNYDVPVVNGRIESSSSVEDLKNIETSSSFLLYSFAEISVATNGFSDSTKIGEGGYGGVYKAQLRGTVVAIKKLDSHSKQSKQEFFQELDILCQMRHQNLVNLIGACFECYALVYEFLPNGSLEDCLIKRSGLLTWKIRTRIIFDICSSLKFLHSRSVVHGDIKPHNILLDASFNGKLADFGLCRFLPKGTTSVAFLETGPKGTFEYIDLEFLETGILKPSSDLYSFGVTILKLVTGQPPLGLSRRVYDAHKNTSDFGKMIDANAGSWPFKLAHELAYWGLQCCYHNEKSSQLMDDMWICLEEMLAEITELQ